MKTKVFYGDQTSDTMISLAVIQYALENVEFIKITDRVNLEIATYGLRNEPICYFINVDLTDDMLYVVKDKFDKIEVYHYSRLQELQDVFLAEYYSGKVSIYDELDDAMAGKIWDNLCVGERPFIIRVFSFEYEGLFFDETLQHFFVWTEKEYSLSDKEQEKLPEYVNDLVGVIKSSEDKQHSWVEDKAQKGMIVDEYLQL